MFRIVFSENQNRIDYLPLHSYAYNLPGFYWVYTLANFLPGAVFLEIFAYTGLLLIILIMATATRRRSLRVIKKE